MEVLSPLVGQEARTLEGLHLYHYGLSNCSQKVRMVLAEKGLGWTNHHLDLAKSEHMTESYLRINPNGVVPTLVHEGRPVVDSSVIMEYLDEEFPEVPLTPETSSLFNAARFKVDMARYPTIQRIHATCMQHPAFDAAQPAKQPDAEP